MKATLDLTRVSTSNLEQLAKLLCDRRQSGQLTSIELSMSGLEGALPIAMHPDVSADAWHAAVMAVLAERRREEPEPAQLVWTGPLPTQTAARDSFVVLQDLLSGAQKSVLIAGFAFDHGKELFAGLHKAMVERKVVTEVFMNVTQGTNTLLTEEDVRKQVRQFLIKNWPFGLPYPQLYYDRRVLTEHVWASIHAKCVAVDEQRTLVTSANFTARGQERNVEVGVFLDDPAFARQLVGQFRRMVNEKLFVEMIP